MDLVKTTAHLISNEELKSNGLLINQDGTTILSDNELDSVIETLEEAKNEIDTLYEQIETELMDLDNSDAPLEEGDAVMVEDGVFMENNSKALKFDHFKNIDTDLDKIIDDNIKQNLASNYNMSDEEALKFANLITRIRHNEKFNIYPELPDVLKTYISDMVEEQNVPLKDKPKVLEYTAKLVIDELINDAELDTLAIDMEEAMKELVPAPLEIYSEFNKDYIENEFLKVADEIKEDKPKTADNLLAMRKGYINAYTYEDMYEVFKNGKIQKNIRRAEVLWSRTNDEYLRLAGVCKFRLHPLNEIHDRLIRLGFTDIQAKRIITLFVYTYTYGVIDYSSEEEYNDIYRNSFANYFEGNIINISISKDTISDFAKEVKDNLNALCNHIDSTIAAKEAELSNKKKKK